MNTNMPELHNTAHASPIEVTWPFYVISKVGISYACAKITTIITITIVNPALHATEKKNLRKCTCVYGTLPTDLNLSPVK